ncbi:hypothetical protein TNCV_5015401 [Trichonephila clavipes]|nr:hypothetical protein TNCV_5015401 [Trichonephila clavipes]
MNKIRKTSAGLGCSAVSLEEFVAVDDNVRIASIRQTKTFWSLFEAQKNIIDADSDDEIEMNSATPVPT